MKEIVLRDHHKLGLVKRVQELERRGFECVAPIKQMNYERKYFGFNLKDKRTIRKYEEMEKQIYYIVKMRGEKDEVTRRASIRAIGER